MTSRMRRGAGIAAVATVALLSLSGETNAGTQGAGDIRTGHVRLTEDHVFQGGFTLGAFVPTGSRSHRCLATLSESNFAVAGTTLYCGARDVDGEPGIFVHVFLPQEAPRNFFITLTVYQKAAEGYGQPIPFE